MKIICFLLLTAIAITSCNNQYKAKPGEVPKSSKEQRGESFGKLTGEDGILIFGKKKKESAGITVNAFLWRAALEAVHNLPIALVDPFSGIITTEWYKPEKSTYRYKMNIIISSDTIRSDAVKVNVFHQKILKGQWLDEAANIQMNQEIENRIFNRAKFLKINN